MAENQYYAEVGDILDILDREEGLRGIARYLKKERENLFDELQAHMEEVDKED